MVLRPQFNLARMFAAIGLIAVALVFLRLTIAESSPDPSSKPALSIVLPLIGCTAFTFAAIGMLLKGVGGAASGLLIGVALGLPLILIVGALDLRFMSP